MAIQPPPLESPIPHGTKPGIDERQLYTPGMHGQPLPDLDRETGRPSKSYWWVWLLVFGLIGYGCYALYKFEATKESGCEFDARHGPAAERSGGSGVRASW